MDEIQPRFTETGIPSFYNKQIDYSQREGRENDFRLLYSITLVPANVTVLLLRSY